MFVICSKIVNDQENTHLHQIYTIYAKELQYDTCLFANQYATQYNICITQKKEAAENY